MHDTSVKTYCLYCEPGQDRKVAAFLNKLGFVSLSPLQVKRYFNHGKKLVRKIPLLPRYVFFDDGSEDGPDWNKIHAIPGVQHILQYGDGMRALRDGDLLFVRWMKSINGLLEVSQVIQVGTKIRVIGGPLAHYEGQILEVKKHRQMVAVEISTEGHIAKIWCPVEYIQTI